jgi:hypothetical protein
MNSKQCARLLYIFGVVANLLRPRHTDNGGNMVKRRQMHGTVQKIIQPVIANQAEKVQIEINEADDLYKEIRVENEVTGEDGTKATLKPGADVKIIVEADSSATLKKPD